MIGEIVAVSALNAAAATMSLRSKMVRSAWAHRLVTVHSLLFLRALDCRRKTSFCTTPGPVYFCKVSIRLVMVVLLVTFTGGLDMPPLLPQPGDCDRCGGNPTLVKRDDDTAEVIDERMRVYRQDTEPVLKFFEKRGEYDSLFEEDACPAMPRF